MHEVAKIEESRADRESRKAFRRIPRPVVGIHGLETITSSHLSLEMLITELPQAPARSSVDRRSDCCPLGEPVIPHKIVRDNNTSVSIVEIEQVLNILFRIAFIKGRTKVFVIGLPPKPVIHVAEVNFFCFSDG